MNTNGFLLRVKTTKFHFTLFCVIKWHYSALEDAELKTYCWQNWAYS